MRVSDLTPLRPYATPTQSKHLEAIIKAGGNVEKAAAAIGRSVPNMYEVIRRLKTTAALRGYNADAPLHSVVLPDAFVTKGRSTLKNKNGDTILEWHKTKLGPYALEDLAEAVMRGMAAVLPIADPISVPQVFLKDLMTVYPVGDPHAGMYAYVEETGNAFDLNIYRATQMAAIDAIVDSAPPSSVAVYNDKGDTLHVADNKSRTLRHGHELVTQGRFIEMVEVALEVKRYHIARLLQKHETVIVRIDPGNHDDHAAIMLAMWLKAHYQNEPRVQVNTSPNPYWYYQFGKVMVCTTHGDGPKEADIGKIMAFDQKEMWGDTEHKVAIMGHEHHGRSKDVHGVIVHYVPTMAPNDAHHHLKGYRSLRQMKALVYHAEFGPRAVLECSEPYIAHFHQLQKPVDNKLGLY